MSATEGPSPRRVEERAQAYYTKEFQRAWVFMYSIFVVPFLFFLSFPATIYYFNEDWKIQREQGVDMKGNRLVWGPTIIVLPVVGLFVYTWLRNNWIDEAARRDLRQQS
jgi:hypothetical protein